jgi:O-antigen biosynthesis protein
MRGRFEVLRVIATYRVFPNLPIETSDAERRTARVCIATYEILGPSKTGGIGTAYHSLAMALAKAKHQVTILYLWAARSDEREMRYWQNQFRPLGITFVPLPVSSGLAGVPDCMQIASDAHAWLRKQEQFDVIHFPELHGHAYYCVLAKKQGIDFSHTILCIGTHSPISWIREQNKEAPYSPEELEMDFMERQSVALADVVVSPSQYMLHWMKDHGWTLPSTCYVQQNIASDKPMNGADLVRMDGAVHRATELVFFGRLEARKGLGLFCDALDHLRDLQLPGFSVAFLGKSGRIEGRDAISYIKARAARWAFPCRTLSDYGREEALQFLAADPGRLAVIPSFEDNLPNTVMECLADNLPFLAGKGGGIPELIAHSDLDAVTFLPNSRELADRLMLAIESGVPAARPAIDPAENRQRWINWHAALASYPDRDRKAEQDVCSAQPVVTVCMHYRGDHELLSQSLESVRRQSYSRVDVLLSDYSGGGAEAELDRLIGDFESKGLEVVTRAASDGSTAPMLEARGEYVIFMEASDCLAPDAVATFVKVASRTGADILTCFLALFSSRQAPAEQECLGHYPFLGKATLSGVFRNHFGRRIIFVKKDALERLRNFPGNTRRDCADWEFLAHAALIDCPMEVVAIPLGWYRISSELGPCPPIDYLDQVSAVTPYTQLMPWVLRDLPGAALTMGLQYKAVYKRLADSPGYAVLQHLSGQWGTGDGDSVAADEGALLPIINRMPRRARKKIVSLLEGWLEYSSARSRIPARGIPRVSHIARQLIRGHYHRYGHGLGSALRDLRKASKLGSQMEEN